MRTSQLLFARALSMRNSVRLMAVALDEEEDMNLRESLHGKQRHTISPVR